MFCKNCGTKNKDGAKVCVICGEKLPEFDPNAVSAQRAVMSSSPKNDNKKLAVGIGAAVVAILVILGIILALLFSENEEEKEDSRRSAAATENTADRNYEERTTEDDRQTIPEWTMDESTTEEEETTERPTETTTIPPANDDAVIGKWYTTTEEPLGDGLTLKINVYWEFSKNGTMKTEINKAEVAQAYREIFTKVFKEAADNVGIGYDDLAKGMGYNTFDELIEAKVTEGLDKLGETTVTGTWERVSENKIKTVAGGEEEVFTYAVSGKTLTLIGEDGDAVHLKKA